MVDLGKACPDTTVDPFKVEATPRDVASKSAIRRRPQGIFDLCGSQSLVPSPMPNHANPLFAFEKLKRIIWFRGCDGAVGQAKLLKCGSELRTHSKSKLAVAVPWCVRPLGNRVQSDPAGR
jgi:hypothetical protein